MEYLLTGRVFDAQTIHENWSVRINSETGKIDEAREGRSGASTRERGHTKNPLITLRDDMTILPGLIDAHVHFFGAKGVE